MVLRHTTDVGRTNGARLKTVTHTHRRRINIVEELGMTTIPARGHPVKTLNILLGNGNNLTMLTILTTMILHGHQGMRIRLETLATVSGLQEKSVVANKGTNGVVVVGILGKSLETRGGTGLIRRIPHQRSFRATMVGNPAGEQMRKWPLASRLTTLWASLNWTMKIGHGSLQRRGGRLSTIQ